MATPKKSIGSSRRFYFNLANFSNNLTEQLRQKPYAFTVLIVILTLAAVVLIIIFVQKELLIAANINGRFLSGPEFYKELLKNKGEEVFDNIVRETLVEQEAKKKGISATQEEIDNKIAEIEKSLGGKENLDQALAQRSLTMEDLKKQITLQILVEKLLADKISVSEEDIDKYIAENGEAVKDSSREEIEQMIRSSKINDEFAKWYEELKKSAKITKFF